MHGAQRILAFTQADGFHVERQWLRIVSFAIYLNGESRNDIFTTVPCRDSVFSLYLQPGVVIA